MYEFLGGVHLSIVTRYRKELNPIIQALEHMPSGRKVIITDPQSELIELVYSGMKKQGGTLIIVDADIAQDERLNKTVQRIMLQAQTDHVGFGLLWTVDKCNKEEMLR